MIKTIVFLFIAGKSSRRLFLLIDRISLKISSAGVGRTGVFITLYYLLDAIERQQKLNVKYIVDTIRLYRPHLVQTIVCTILIY